MAWGSVVNSPMIFRPTSTQELSEFIRSTDKFRINGYWNSSSNEPQFDAEIDLGGNSGIIDFSPSDQVVKLRSGTTIGQLNSELRKSGQIIAIFNSVEGEPWGAWNSLSVADCLAWNLPHALEFQHGSWRDWILGATIVGADGMIYKSGSSVVKSVAGYDIHRLMIGARQTLGVIAEVILRTTPISTMKQTEIDVKIGDEKHAPDGWRIQRCLRSDWEAMKQALSGRIAALDPATCTAYCYSSQDENLRFPSDWIMETSSRSQHFSDTHASYMRRAKQIFDPPGKLNPGAMGIF
jgi:glycolate oxidase FAD binding subunit